MSQDPDARADEVPAPPRRPWTRWRVGTPAVILLCGGLLVVSATNSEGTDLRPGRYADMASLARTEAEEYDALQERVGDLTAEVETLTAAVNDRTVNRYHRRIDNLEDPAGLSPRSGPGVTVTLSDAPEDVINATSLDLNLLVVHQQDIQAVVNALWLGGADAVTVQGQRVVSTTGIKCEGNAVQLQGVPYPEPYSISAVGDPLALTQALEDNDYLELYRDQAENPDISVGWDMRVEERITAPAYDGLLDLSYAEPLR